MSAEALAARAVADGLQPAVAAALALLRRVRGMVPTQAQAELRALADRLAPVRIDLLPERDHYSGAREYGLLMRDEAETAYVTLRGREQTPWLLREVHDFHESILLAVDAETLQVGEAVAALDDILAQPSWCERLIELCIVNRELKQRDFVVSDAELQAEVDAMRRRRGLFTLADTERWMRARGMTQQRLEKMATLTLNMRRLRRALFVGDLEQHFASRRHELARASLVRLRFATVEEARHASNDLSSREQFFALADRLSQRDLARGLATPRLDAQVVSRPELTPEHATLIFARAGVVVGPLPMAEGAYLLYVSAIEAAETLDDAARDTIERQLFAQWLRRERERAVIKWNWGVDA